MPSPERSAPRRSIYLTDVAGLLPDVDDPTTIVAQADVAELEAAIADGTIIGRHDPQGRKPASMPCGPGAASAHMLDGRIPHVLLLELFTDAGIGTMITDSHDSSNAGRNMR